MTTWNDTKTIHLKDDPFQIGGVDTKDESLYDFLQIINGLPTDKQHDLDDADKWFINGQLMDFGIMPIFEVDEETIWNPIYSRIYQKTLAFLKPLNHLPITIGFHNNDIVEIVIDKFLNVATVLEDPSNKWPSAEYYINRQVSMLYRSLKKTIRNRQPKKLINLNLTEKVIYKTY